MLNRGRKKAERKGRKRKKSKASPRDTAEIPQALISTKIAHPYAAREQRVQADSSEGLSHLHCSLWAGDWIQVMQSNPYTNLSNKDCHARLKTRRLRLSEGCDLDQGHTAKSGLPASLLPPIHERPPLGKRQNHSEGDVTLGPLAQG